MKIIKEIDHYFFGDDGTATEKILYYGALSWGLVTTLFILVSAN